MMMDEQVCVSDVTTQTDVETENKLNLNDTTNSRPHGAGSLPWYKADKYKRYWSHHDKMATWFQEMTHCRKVDQYHEYYRGMGQYHTSMGKWMNQMASYYSNWYSTWLQYQNRAASRQNTHRARQPTPAANHTRQSAGQKRKGGKVKSKSKRHKQRSGRSSPRPQIIRVSSHEQFEMEITDDMKEFFIHSAKHRKERDAKKREIEKKTPAADVHIDLAEANTGKNKATVLPPSERPGAKRTTEMKLLYGKGAAMIHGMETAMQLNYDRNCDLQQPKMWPQLPISIKFS